MMSSHIKDRVDEHGNINTDGLTPLEIMQLKDLTSYFEWMASGDPVNLFRTIVIGEPIVWENGEIATN